MLYLEREDVLGRFPFFGEHALKNSRLAAQHMPAYLYKVVAFFARVDLVLPLLGLRMCV